MAHVSRSQPSMVFVVDQCPSPDANFFKDTGSCLVGRSEGSSGQKTQSML